MAMEGNDFPSPESASAESPGITIRLDAFEGPLDLLLHLIRREEIDIWNIPVARITEQYLEYIQMMQDLNINVAGEWLVMAATLIYIKSRMLLPPDPIAAPSEERAEDPRTELVYQLLEHQKFKQAAHMLHIREEVENAVWNSPPKEVLDEGKDLVSVTLFDLLTAFRDVVARFEKERAFELSQEEVTIEQKIAEIRRLLLVHDTVRFSMLFAGMPAKPHIIVTFLAILELVRLHEIWLYQERAFDEILITKGKSFGEAA